MDATKELEYQLFIGKVIDQIGQDKALRLLDEAKNTIDSLKGKDLDYISYLLKYLREDPNARDYERNYKELPEYLWELIEKDGSLLGGLINALELYLNK